MQHLKWHQKRGLGHWIHPLRHRPEHLHYPTVLNQHGCKADSCQTIVEKQPGSTSGRSGWHLQSHSMPSSTPTTTQPWKFLCVFSSLLDWPKKTRRQHFYHHYMTSQLPPDLCLLVCSSRMISGLSTSAGRDALIMGAETTTKLNIFSTEVRAILQTIPANVSPNSSANPSGRQK